MSFNRMIHRLPMVAVAARAASTIPSAAAFASRQSTASGVGVIGSRSVGVGSTRLFSSPPVRFLLSYDYIPDVLEKRGPFREAHLGLANDLVKEGTCISGGPCGPPGEGPSGALFVFTTKDAAEKFVEDDPYVSNGIVTGHSISEWTVGVGTN